VYHHLENNMKRIIIAIIITIPLCASSSYEEAVDNSTKEAKKNIIEYEEKAKRYLSKPLKAFDSRYKEIIDNLKPSTRANDKESLSTQREYLKEREQQFNIVKNVFKNMGEEDSIWAKLANKEYASFKEKTNFEKIVNSGPIVDNFTVMYFVDSEVSNKKIILFGKMIDKLKGYYPQIHGMVMMRGLVNDNFDGSYLWMKSLVEDGLRGTIKIKPIAFNAFDFFNIREVPAFGLAYCNNSDYRFKECSKEYLVKGDIGLTAFMEIVAKENKDYQKYYQALISPEIINKGKKNEK